MEKPNIKITGLGLEIYYENLGDTLEWSFYEAGSSIKNIWGEGWRFPLAIEMEQIKSLRELGIIQLYYGSYWCNDPDGTHFIYYSTSKKGEKISKIPTGHGLDMTMMLRPVRSI
jgi:hypothetical protein